MNAKSTQVPETVVEPQSTQEAPADAGARSVKVRFDDRAMISNYANVANVGMSKDEVTLPATKKRRKSPWLPRIPQNCEPP